MSKKETVKRYILFIISLFFSALGVALTKTAGLGISPISSFPNVISMKFTAVSMGTWVFLWCCVLLLGQILILRKDFKPIQLLQLPLSFIFGNFIDLCMRLVSSATVNSYPMRIFFVILGVIVLAFGVSLAVTANVIMNSGEAFVKAVADKTGKNFGSIKTVFDVGCVTIAVIASLIFFDMKVVGVREGTVIVSLCTGTVVRFFNRFITKPLNKILTK
ncbi:MAG: YitT family protein [Acutalibacteraceae bacterium]